MRKRKTRSKGWKRKGMDKVSSHKEGLEEKGMSKEFSQKEGRKKKKRVKRGNKHAKRKFKKASNDVKKVNMRKRASNLKTRHYRKSRIPKKRPQMRRPQSTNPLKLQMDEVFDRNINFERCWDVLRDDELEPRLIRL